jgi:hypothetical protein
LHNPFSSQYLQAWKSRHASPWIHNRAISYWISYAFLRSKQSTNFITPPDPRLTRGASISAARRLKPSHVQDAGMEEQVDSRSSTQQPTEKSVSLQAHVWELVRRCPVGSLLEQHVPAVKLAGWLCGCACRPSCSTPPSH